MKTPSSKPSTPALSAFGCLCLVSALLLAPPFILAQQRPASAKAAPKLSGNFESDAGVLIESQEKALEMAKGLAEKADSPRAQAALTEVVKQMERALKMLEEAKAEPKKLEAAVAAQQASYQALLKLAEREIRVTEKKGGKSGKGGEQGRQGQLDQLELKMNQNRYEQQKQAKAEPQQSPEQKENLQFMSRLRELAQRQNDLNERLKELQTALQEAKNEQEKEEIRRRLKRLQEEQKQMLADLDELKQRTEKPENQQRMAETKDKLDQTRDAAQKAAEQMEKGNVSQALASGTRAQRDLQEMREDLRKKNANQFAEDMKQLRQEARDIAQKQEELGKQLTATPQQNKKKSLTEPSAKSELPQELAEQNKRLASLVDRATQIAEQSENAEPLLHRQLYDTIRKQAQNEAQNLKETKNELTRRGMMTRGLYEMLEKASEQGTTKSLEVASELAKNGMTAPASGVEQRARAGIEELRKGVERAAESVLGDETEAMKQAAKTLDNLVRQLERELARGEAKDGEKGGEPQAGQQPGDQKGKQGQQAQADGKQPGKQAGKQGEGKAGQDSKDGKQGEAQAGAEPGEGKQPGEKGGKQGSKSGQEGKEGEGKEGSKAGQGGKQGEGKQGEGKEGGKSGQGGQQPGGKDGKDGKGGKQGEQPGEGQGKGGGSGQQPGGEQQARPASEFNSSPGKQDGKQANGGQRGGNNQRGGDRGGWEGILPAGIVAERGGEQAGPITSERGFADFSDRLRDVEEMVDSSALRNQLQSVRERVRAERVEFKRHSLEPKWDLVRMQVMKPLVEVRQRIEEELAKRDNREAMVPIDRDPVPGRFSELVRKYYENLGKSEAEAGVAPKGAQK
ncbi:MAG: hypothetical protein FD161_977 [Limisphaerales bacterium]|nr:MAG: hypothetical protein FD161_977 [Limisphaerales bacterium]KAG0509760.1 MAG: hypothetical protein E1N63_977 [Limisphaerales bacterium]TXT51017.1 MAG: hypothetical protein FD140_2079 [Limisphaerales bacterium]